jgi:hypothetical protein
MMVVVTALMALIAFVRNGDRRRQHSPLPLIALTMPLMLIMI